MVVYDFMEFNNFFIIKFFNYWWDYYIFDRVFQCKVKVFGEQIVCLVIINIVVFMFFFYGICKGDDCIRDKGLDIFEKFFLE